MSSSNWIRRGGLAAMVGGILGILCSPFYALAYFATEDGTESLEAPWVAAWAGALRPILEPFLTFAPPEDVYLTYGKLLTLVFLGWRVCWPSTLDKPQVQDGWRSGALVWSLWGRCWELWAASVRTGWEPSGGELSTSRS